jgi:glycine/D-amino acid oxidase-like deaminating enzyme
MQKYDVAVIGGGLIGCASAYYLSLSGARVILIERGQINQGASGQNAGSLHFQLEYRLIEFKEKFAKELEYFVALTQLAINHWKGIEQELKCDLELVMDGGFMVAETTEEIKVLQEKSEIEKSQGLAVDLLDDKEIHKLAPYLSSKVQAALYCPHEGHCNPRLLTPAYARSAQTRGTDILTNTIVADIRLRERKWEIDFSSDSPDTKKETLVASSILNTAGAWAGEIGKMVDIKLPLQAVGLIMNVTEKIPPVLHHLVQHVGRKLSMKQVDDGNVLIGGGWLAELQHKDGVWLSHKPPLINTDSIKENLRVATDVAPFLKELNLIRTWTGITALFPDQLPILGEVPQAPGFYVAVGGSGFTYGPTYARLMSELILTGSTGFPIKPYSPDRFS